MATDSESKLQLVHRHIRAYPDFPKKGILFRDICPILKDPAALTAVIDLFEEHVKKNHQRVDLIVGLYHKQKDLLVGVMAQRRKLLTAGSGTCSLPIYNNHNILNASGLWMDKVNGHVSSNKTVLVGLDARGFLFGPLLAQRLGVGFVLVRKKGKLPGSTVSVTYDLEYGKAEAEIQEDAVAPGQKVLLIDDLLATGGTLYAACELMRKQQAEILGCMVVIELKELNGIDKLKSHSVFSLVQY